MGTENTAPNAAGVLADVPYKTNGKNARFYADHLEFNDKSIRYDDITTLATSCTTTKHTYIGIPFGRSFTGYFRFTTKEMVKNEFRPGYAVWVSDKAGTPFSTTHL